MPPTDKEVETLAQLSCRAKIALDNMSEATPPYSHGLFKALAAKADVYGRKARAIRARGTPYLAPTPKWGYGLTHQSWAD